MEDKPGGSRTEASSRKKGRNGKTRKEKLFTGAWETKEVEREVTMALDLVHASTMPRLFRKQVRSFPFFHQPYEHHYETRRRQSYKALCEKTRRGLHPTKRLAVEEGFVNQTAEEEGHNVHIRSVEVTASSRKRLASEKRPTGSGDNLPRRKQRRRAVTQLKNQSTGRATQLKRLELTNPAVRNQWMVEVVDEVAKDGHPMRLTRSKLQALRRGAKLSQQDRRPAEVMLKPPSRKRVRRKPRKKAVKPVVDHYSQPQPKTDGSSERALATPVISSSKRPFYKPGFAVGMEVYSVEANFSSELEAVLCKPPRPLQVVEKKQKQDAQKTSLFQPLPVTERITRPVRIASRRRRGYREHQTPSRAESQGFDQSIVYIVSQEDMKFIPVLNQAHTCSQQSGDNTDTSPLPFSLLTTAVFERVIEVFELEQHLIEVGLIDSEHSDEVDIKSRLLDAVKAASACPLKLRDVNNNSIEGYPQNRQQTVDNTQVDGSVLNSIYDYWRKKRDQNGPFLRKFQQSSRLENWTTIV